MADFGLILFLAKNVRRRARHRCFGEIGPGWLLDGIAFCQAHPLVPVPITRGTLQLGAKIDAR